MGWLDWLDEIVNIFGGGSGGADLGQLAQGVEGTAPADYLMGSWSTPDYNVGDMSPMFGSSGEGSNWMTDYLGSANPTPEVSPGTGGGSDWSKWIGPAFSSAIGPAIGLGSTLLGSNSQANAQGAINDANQQAYERQLSANTDAYNQYLTNLNPPESVLDAREQQLLSEIQPKATARLRQTTNDLAARGVRGRGKAAPLAATAREIQDQQNQAYWRTHGTYNVPGSPMQVPQVAAQPQLGYKDFLGKNLSDLGSTWFSYSYAPESLRRKYA